MSIKKYLEKIKKLLFPYSPFKKFGENPERCIKEILEQGLEIRIQNNYIPQYLGWLFTLYFIKDKRIYELSRLFEDMDNGKKLSKNYSKYIENIISNFSK